MTYISWSGEFALYLEDYLMAKKSFFGIMSQWDITFDLIISRSQ